MNVTAGPWLLEVSDAGNDTDPTGVGWAITGAGRGLNSTGFAAVLTAMQAHLVAANVRSIPGFELRLSPFNGFMPCVSKGVARAQMSTIAAVLGAPANNA